MTTPAAPSARGSTGDPPVWLEAALNGAWTRARQPLIPTDPADIIREGIACATLGAAIIHVHAYDQAGNPTEDVDTYTRIIEGIREKQDVIVYPTIASLPGDHESPARYEPLEALVRRDLLEWIPIDPGSVNINSYARISSGEAGHVYLNSERHIRRGLALAAEAGIHPTFAIYEPGFIRLGAALATSTPGLPEIVYRLMFTTGRAWGFPAEEYALVAYAELLRREAPRAPWMIAGHDLDLTPLVASTIWRGGHVRVGLEDAPHGSTWSNERWVGQTVDAIVNGGQTIASAQDVRRTLKPR